MVDPPVAHSLSESERSRRDKKPVQTLARHYGFKDEGLDFITHYDIKYRMGQDAGEAAEG